jgi:RNA polymerase-associated protein RTF1
MCIHLPERTRVYDVGSRATMTDSESDKPSPESEEDDDEGANPYPLEGKYKDEADREQYVAAL